MAYDRPIQKHQMNYSVVVTSKPTGIRTVHSSESKELAGKIFDAHAEEEKDALIQLFDGNRIIRSHGVEPKLTYQERHGEPAWATGIGCGITAAVIGMILLFFYVALFR